MSFIFCPVILCHIILCHIILCHIICTMLSRSITRQYFRKADAVIVVYDITNETSFLNAKHWILSAHEAINPTNNHGNNDGIVFLLLGNKLDLADDDVLRYCKT